MKIAKLFIVAILTANSLAAYAGILLDADSVGTGSTLDTTPLITSFGTVSFMGEIRSTSDDDFIAVGSTGDVFDITDSTGQAIFSFDFDVSSISFIFGGNLGVFDITARDGVGNVVDSFFTNDTDDGAFAGPLTLSGTGIRSLFWTDPGFSYAALDNITITAEAEEVPEPAGIALLGLGLLGIFFSRRRNVAQSI